MLQTAAPPRLSLWPIRFYYLFTGMSGFLLPFLGLFYVDRGLSGTQIGWLGTIGSLTALLIAPFWGKWSDRIAHPRGLLRFSLIGSATFYLLMSQQRDFIQIALIVLFQSLIIAGMEPISDSLAMGSVQEEEKAGFGSIRVWGSLGWAMASFVSGWLIERIGLIVAFFANAGGAILSVMTLSFIPMKAKKVQTNQERPHTRGLIRYFQKDRAMVGLAIALSLLWVTRMGVFQFEPIYMQQLGAGETLIGLTSTLGAMPELFGMLWADRLVRLHGSQCVLKWGILLFAGTAAGVALLPTILTIITMRSVSGIAFSFYWVALIVFINERSPLDQTATTMALYLVTLRELVSIVGAPLSGMVFDFLGTYWLYPISVAGTLMSWLILRMSVTGKRSLFSTNSLEVQNYE
ncbi:MAG TPA: MFS transporter [Anaerolineales bacterium]|nr:MFS transporter [Anaerolineales bacterium]